MPATDLTDTVMNLTSYTELLLRFLLDLFSIFVLVRLVYYPLHRQKDYLFTFFLFNLILFLICTFLGASMMKMGFAFGLFAIFSMIRYRTVSIPIKEMGYFFVCVAMGMLNALATADHHYLVLLGANAVILLAVLILDRFVHLKHENKQEIIYDRIELILPERRAELLADLRQRTGLNIHRAEIANINFLRDVALVRVFYYDTVIHENTRLRIEE